LGKTALVVDDSKTARVVLQQMLETHELDVDTAESAEDALAYLSSSRPDIIFMDHEMPGMDGLEAVSAIKNNPATATIPIMMYTAQQGEVYVGQARALGAVGVLPKQLEPVEVSKVLESLRIIGEDAEEREQHEEAAAKPDSGIYPSLDDFDKDLRVMIQDLFDQQRYILRRELRDSHQEIAARIAGEMRPPVTEDVEEEVPKRESKFPDYLQIAVTVMIVITVAIALLFWQKEQSLRDLQQQNVDLQSALDARRAIAVKDSVEVQQELGTYRQSLEVATGVAVDSLVWAANQSAQYGVDEIPMGDYRLSVLQKLSSHLETLNFRGVVRIESHVGDFCMAFSPQEGYVLAPPDLPATQCDRLGLEPAEAYEMGLRQSVAFANFISISGEPADGAVRYEIISFGNSNPLLDYPVTPVDITAAVWNDIAASNNRVDISIFPDL
jgi:CheY-like chemotaxis protein